MYVCTQVPDVGGFLMLWRGHLADEGSLLVEGSTCMYVLREMAMLFRPKDRKLSLLNALK